MLRHLYTLTKDLLGLYLRTHLTGAYVGDYFEWNGSPQTMTKYYYAGGQRVAVRNSNGTGTNGLAYLLGDHLGSTNLTADPLDGDKLSELRYKAWGETRYSLTSAVTDRRYTGQIEESSLGLYFFNARWYDAALGRWAQPDSIVPLGSQGVQAWDRYAFVNNNPLRYNDPTGHMQACPDGDLGGGCGSAGYPVVSTRGDSSTPYDVGVEWLTGTGERHHEFREGDPFTE